MVRGLDGATGGAGAAGDCVGATGTGATTAAEVGAAGATGVTLGGVRRGARTGGGGKTGLVGAAGDKTGLGAASGGAESTGFRAGADGGLATGDGAALAAASLSLTNTTRGEKISPKTRPVLCRRTTSRAFSVPRNKPRTSASTTSACVASTWPCAETVSRPPTFSGPPSKRPSICTSPSATS